MVLAEATLDSFMGDFAYLAQKFMEMESCNVLFALANMEEKVQVVARIRAIPRRTREQVEDDPIIRVGDLEINEDSHDVSRAGHAIDLSPTEYKLLRYLMDNEGRVLSKAQILDHVWQYDWGGDAAIVESYISYLRKKVDGIMVTDDNGEQHKVTPLIETKRGIGYMIREPRVSA